MNTDPKPTLQYEFGEIDERMRRILAVIRRWNKDEHLSPDEHTLFNNVRTQKTGAETPQLGHSAWGARRQMSDSTWSREQR